MRDILYETDYTYMHDERAITGSSGRAVETIKKFELDFMRKERQTCDHLSPLEERFPAKAWGSRSATTAKVIMGAPVPSRHSDTSVPCPSLLDRCQNACRSPILILSCCVRLSNDTCMHRRTQTCTPRRHISFGRRSLVEMPSHTRG